MIRPVSLLPALAALSLAVAPASARKAHHSAQSDEVDAGPTSSKSKKDKGDGAAGKPVQVGTFGDWGAYLAKGKSKTCYALASPKERKPEGKRETAYVFIADRPAEKVVNEVSIIMGFPLKENGAATAKVGSTSFDLVTKGSNAWIKNVADEKKFVEALKHSSRLVVKAPSARGVPTTDTYMLDGVKPALDLVAKDCR